ERFAKCGRPWARQHLVQRIVRDATDRRMEEARTHCPVRFDHGGYPGRVAQWGSRFLHPKMRAEMAHDAGPLLACFEDIAAGRQRFNLALERRDVTFVQAYFGLTVGWPALRPIESRGCQVRRQERYRAQTHLAGRFNCSAEAGAVLLLDRAARCDREVWLD